MCVASGVFGTKGVLGLEGVVLVLGRALGYFCCVSSPCFVLFAAPVGVLVPLEGVLGSTRGVWP